MKIKTTKWIAVCMVAMMGLFAIGCDSGSDETKDSIHETEGPSHGDEDLGDLTPGGSSGQFTLSETTLTVPLNETKKLTVTPASITVVWSSSDEEIATVEQDGTVTGKKVGTAIITATLGDDSKTCVVTVAETVSTDSPGSSGGDIKLNHTELTLTPKSTIQLTVTPADTKVTWSSKNTQVATVSESGRVSISKDAIKIRNDKYRTVDIIAKTADGKELKCEITVCWHEYDDGKCSTCGFPKPTVYNGDTFCVNDKGELKGFPTTLGPSSEDAVIPEGVVSIDYRAFEDNNVIKSVKIPSSMQSICEPQFSTCENFKDVYYSGTKAEWDEIVFVRPDFSDDVTIHGYEADGITEITWKYNE